MRKNTEKAPNDSGLNMLDNSNGITRDDIEGHDENEH